MASSTLSADLVEKVQDSWRIASLKDYQKKALAAVVMEKRDCLVCVPTGSGKSLCFEALCMVADHIHNHRHSQNASDCENVQASSASGIPANGTVLVISPLVALIEKQV